MRIYNLKTSALTQKLLQGVEYSTELQRQRGLDATQWTGTGVSVVSPNMVLSISGGGVLSKVVIKLPTTPAFFTRLSSDNWAEIKMQLKNSSNNGYQITFPTSTTTQIVISRLDGGTPTTLGTHTTSWLWGSEEIELDFLFYAGGIAISLFGEIVLQVADDTYRLTNWQLSFVPVSSSAFLYVYKFHCLKIHAETIEYCINLIDSNSWTSGTLQAGYISLAAGYDCIYTGLILPKEDYSIKIDFANVATNQHSSMWGVKSPDGNMGLYLYWSGGVFYLKKVNDNGTLASGGSNLKTSTSTLRVNVGGSGHIYGVCGATTLDTTQLSYHIANCILFFKDVSATETIKINGIYLSNDDSTYGFNDWTYEAVANNATSSRKIIRPI